MASRLVIGAAALAVMGCAHATNYTDAASPRYAGPVAAAEMPKGPVPDTLRVVTFNVQWASHPEIAGSLLEHNDSLRNADVIFLQEMDERGTKIIADSLGMGYVFYPATRHWKTGRDFGNAILSRWPLQDDRKIMLPHLARWNQQQRIAVAATMIVGDRRIRVYDVHLATMVNNGPTERREQLRRVLADADSFPVAIIGGDFNSETVADHYNWPTHGLPHTESLWTLDHMLLRGLVIAGPGGVGIVRNNLGASDHRPVWAHLVMDQHTPATPTRVIAAAQTSATQTVAARAVATQTVGTP
jgi:endonuclease/exonuclease/phosphatase family metal-dependent hydrolase